MILAVKDAGQCYQVEDGKPEWTGDMELLLSGTSEELEALSSALLMKAKFPTTFFHTYTGISGVKLEIGCTTKGSEETSNDRESNY